jgi:hypothetical protein
MADLATQHLSDNLMTPEERDFVLGIIERLLHENAGAKLTNSLIAGIVITAQRLVPTNESSIPQA